MHGVVSENSLIHLETFQGGQKWGVVGLSRSKGVGFVEIKGWKVERMFPCSKGTVSVMENLLIVGSDQLICNMPNLVIL